MPSVLGDNAKKWIEIILSFRGDPSKYGIPQKIFDLPKLENEDVNSFLAYAKMKWQKIRVRSMNPYKKIDKRVPFWMVFTLPRRPATLYLSVWDNIWEQRDKDLYQDLHYNFQELIQNFIREELKLFNTVRPFRQKTGSSVLSFESDLDDELKPEINEQIKAYTSPQKILHNVAHFVRNKTIQAGIAYILIIERFSKLISKTQTAEEIEKVTRKFQQEIIKLQRTDFEKKIPTASKASQEIPVDDDKSPTIIEFTKIKLQEYDGYVELQCNSDVENRNFRIYDCVEEDLLREEMWKNRRYPLRRLIDEVLDERYSRPNKKYTLKYGVDIKILEPNWIS